MASRQPPPPVRPCPLCGVAMQASKSRDQSPHFDTYDCLSCQTTIVEAPLQPPGERKSTS